MQPPFPVSAHGAVWTRGALTRLVPPHLVLPQGLITLKFGASFFFFSECFFFFFFYFLLLQTELLFRSHAEPLQGELFMPAGVGWGGGGGVRGQRAAHLVLDRHAR